MQNFNVSMAPSRLDQVINPWTWNINLGGSSDPTLERRMLDEVGSYGRQIGQIGDAVGVLASLVDRSRLTDPQREVLETFDKQLKLIDLLKQARRLELELGGAKP
jgi:hypothetical protein